jgi:hypothetical protein
MLCRRSCKPMVNVNRMRVPCSRFRAESGKRVPQIPHANMHYVNVEQLETSKMGNDVQCYKDQTLSQALHCQEQHLWARRTSPKKWRQQKRISMLARTSTDGGKKLSYTRFVALK